MFFARFGQSQPAGLQQPLEAREELAPKHLRERRYRKQETAARTNPVPVSMQRPGTDQSMDMQVLAKVLAPGMQHQGGGDLPTEPAWIGTEFEQCIGGGLEQEVVDWPWIGLRQHV